MSGTSFSHLAGNVAIGRWGAEECFDAEDGCIWHDGAVIFAGEGKPLPALMYDVSTGRAWTLPQSGFVRPSYSS